MSLPLSAFFDDVIATQGLHLVVDNARLPSLPATNSAPSHLRYCSRRPTSHTSLPPIPKRKSRWTTDDSNQDKPPLPTFPKKRFSYPDRSTRVRTPIFMKSRGSEQEARWGNGLALLDEAIQISMNNKDDTNDEYNDRKNIPRNDSCISLDECMLPRAAIRRTFARSA